MSKEIIPIERVVRSIRWIRGHKVLLDSDLAILYGVTTGNVNKAVKRNADRFPSDFMFQLKAEELANFEIPICNIKMGAGDGARRDQKGRDAKLDSMCGKVRSAAARGKGVNV
jgi:ORF6N domain